MAKVKKFGTFSGVFTPSILTILGVIMYLRFPTIIGQAGLINTIGIIVIAHIISVTTSLSVASLSTDKTVKTGGTYFMISRSLGLPIGGTLGLALFVGLSFSVSLYLIGFAESFLAYWNMEASINNIRLAGTAILIIVTTITFISTSLAIKSQYFIMAAIGLSLLSIFLGKHDFHPTEIHFQPLAGAAPFMVLFGIFFPAVTGFEAGVSMSGDLKNPKKSLPYGAMAAVGVGFIVYIGLALFYAFTVDAEILMNDSQVLFKISLVPVLVIIGIWGATLSSALGSILGAPRILQAIAMDKIAPAVFAKGAGKTQEPRNALLLAFAIAESGILIGQLDVIARIVSMFFITTYAFLNLASAIESWSSSDFRPAFKIPRFVSVLGAGSAFIVMILLDFIALAGAVIVLGVLYFYLRRKELVLESGDAWSSFWTNLAKRSLLKLSVQKTENRNWRPNIVLFSGGQQARPHLLEMGIAMTGKLGALTDFELVISENPYQQTSAANSIKKEKADANFFQRKFVCSSVQEGIKSVTNIYGFSGFEPNTVMLGWSRETKNAVFLAETLTHVKRKNMNAILLDYDKDAGFGKKENIDIWWNGKGRHLNFALNLIRFLMADPDWRDATVRVLIIASDNNLTDKLYRNTKLILTEKRMDAEIKVIGNDFGTRSKEMIINSESANADLILLGISPNSSAYTKSYIESISKITQLPSSILILSPSDEFEEINIVDQPAKPVTEEKLPVADAELKPVPLLENKLVQARIEKLDQDLQNIIIRFAGETWNKGIGYQLGFLNNLKEYAAQNFAGLKNVEASLKGEQAYKATSKLHHAVLAYSSGIFEKSESDWVAETRHEIEKGVAALRTQFGNFVFETPESILISLVKSDSTKEKNKSVGFRELAQNTVDFYLMPEILNRMEAFQEATVKLLTGLKDIQVKVNDLYEKHYTSDDADALDNETGEILHALDVLGAMLQDLRDSGKLKVLSVARNQVIQIASQLYSAKTNSKISARKKKWYKIQKEKMDGFAELWEENTNLLMQSIWLDGFLLTNQDIVLAIIENFAEKTELQIRQDIIQAFDNILNNIEKWETGKPVKIKNVIYPSAAEVRYQFQETYTKIAEIIEKFPESIEIAESIFGDSESVDNKTSIQAAKVEPRKIARYYLDTRFYEPFYRELEELDKYGERAVIECREAVSLLKFRFENLQQEQLLNQHPENETAGFLHSLKKQVAYEKEQLENVLRKTAGNAGQLVKTAFAPVFTHSIIDSEQKISALLREQKGRKFGLGIAQKMDFVKNRITGIMVDLLYKSSGGRIQAEQYLSKKQVQGAGVADILEFSEIIIPEPKIFRQIPVFYRTLFSSRSLINDDFWVPMEKETELVKKAIFRHKNGFGGAVLIKGVHGSGKTALTRYCMWHFFRKDRIFTLQAPLNGSVKPDDLLHQLRMATGSSGNAPDILKGLPHESVLIINDLELWWERSENGNAALAELINWIGQFGDKLFFMLNCNSYSYNLIKQVFPVENQFITTVDCQPFDSKKLQLLLQNRHKSSGLNYFYKGSSEEAVSPLNTAALFNAYFNCSHGIPGVAMNFWTASITGVESHDITIKKPEVPHTDVLKSLNPDWLVVLAMFVQHKCMDAGKLARVMNFSVEEAESLIRTLTGVKLLQAKENEVYILGRYIEPFVVNVCAEKGII